MDSAKGMASASEAVKQSPVAKHKVRERVVIFLFGAISLGAFVVLAFSFGVGSTHKYRMSVIGSTPQHDRNREIKQSILAAGHLSIYVLAVALPPFLMIGADAVRRAQWSIRSKFACWAVVLVVFGLAWWCSYRFGAHVGGQMPDWVI
jgi:hypothetical protein